MGRVWMLTGALMVCSVLMWILNSFIGIQGMLTIGLCIGAGAAAAYIQGNPTLVRAIFLVVGVLIGALGFLLGAAAFPDTATGLFLGALVPQVLIGVTAMWTKRIDAVIAALIGAGALAGVYANDFDLDPQSINISLPIALGQTLLPLGLGYLAGILVRSFVPDDPSTLPAVAPKPAPAEESTVDSILDDTQAVDWEEAR